MKPEQRLDEVSQQMSQRKKLNEKLSGLVAMRDKYGERELAAPSSLIVRPLRDGEAVR